MNFMCWRNHNILSILYKLSFANTFEKYVSLSFYKFSTNDSVTAIVHKGTGFDISTLESITVPIPASSLHKSHKHNAILTYHWSIQPRITSTPRLPQDS